MKKFLPLLLIVFIALVSCSDDSSSGNDGYDNPIEIATVQFINMSNTYEDLDFIYKSHRNDAYYYLENISFGEQSQYYDFYADENIYRAYITNTDIIVARDTVSLIKDAFYSVIAVDLDATVNPVLYTLLNADSTLASGNAQFKIFSSLNHDTLNVVDHNTEEVIVYGVKPYQASGYIELSEGTYLFDIINAESGALIGELNALTFIEGVNYTSIIYFNEDAEPRIKAFQENSINLKRAIPLE